MIDWDFGIPFNPTDRLTVRPVLGLRGGWIHQSFDTAFQASYLSSGAPVQKDFTETMTNNFWGLGPKLGIENSFLMARGDAFEFSWVANLYIAYLWGQWSISDVSHTTTNDNGVITESTHRVETRSRDFGSMAFQTLVGFSVKHRGLSATVGYELNDWLNQGQIFDDATGPHNNDLLLQGLTVRGGYSY